MQQQAALGLRLARSIGCSRPVQRCCCFAAAAAADSAASGSRLGVHAPPPAAAAAAATAAAAAAADGAPLEPGLYVVGTPIGNLEDISLRALRVLRRANLVLAEDTRHTRKLLEHFNIRNDTSSFHAHNERARQDWVLQRLAQGEPIALVSDAGMPGISDPGSQLVAAAVAAGVRVVPVPGPCAAIAALAASGLPTDTFHFVGFLPAKPGRRRAALQQLLSVPATLVFYVPPHGLSAILSDMADVLGGQRQAVVARELTKLHEEFYRGTLSECLAEFGAGGRRDGVVKGELVLLVQGTDQQALQQEALLAAAAAAAATRQGQQGDAAAAAAGAGAAAAAASLPLALDSSDGGGGTDAALRQLLAAELAAGNSVSGSSKALAKRLQLPRSRLYRLALELEQHGI